MTALTNALEIHRQILERAESREVITPGVTTIGDVGTWVKNEFFKRRLTGYRIGSGGPRVLYSAVSKLTRPPDVRYFFNQADYVLQRGDFFTYDTSVRYLDYFQTDYKRNAYILREGKQTFPRKYSMRLIVHWQQERSFGKM